MAAPIGAAPILEGKEATEWWEKVKKTGSKTFIGSNPEIRGSRREIAASANKKPKK